MLTGYDPELVLSITADVGDRIRTLRKSAHLSQAHLGSLVGVSGTQISKCETGTNRLTLPMLAKLAGVFGVSAPWLAGTQDRRQPHLSLTSAEADLLRAYRALSNIDMQISVSRLLASLAERRRAEQGDQPSRGGGLALGH